MQAIKFQTFAQILQKKPSGIRPATKKLYNLFASKLLTLEVDIDASLITLSSLHFSTRQNEVGTQGVNVSTSAVRMPGKALLACCIVHLTALD